MKTAGRVTGSRCVGDVGAEVSFVLPQEGVPQFQDFFKDLEGELKFIFAVACYELGQMISCEAWIIIKFISKSHMLYGLLLRRCSV